jgi:hypothetical protein
MNKKLLVLAVVPLIVGLGGAFAFSWYNGTAWNNANVTAGTASMTMQTELDGGQAWASGLTTNYAYSTVHPSTSSSGACSDVGIGAVQGGAHAILPGAAGGGCSSLPNLGGVVTILATGMSTSTVYTSDVGNLAPGVWVYETIELTNTGSLPLTVWTEILGPSPQTTIPIFLQHLSGLGPISATSLPGWGFQADVFANGQHVGWGSPGAVEDTVAVGAGGTELVQVWLGLGELSSAFTEGQTAGLTLQFQVSA